jgi:hypothetical protein
MTATQQPTTASPIDAHPAPTQSTSRRSGKATTAMVLGIIGVIAVLIPIAAIVLGIVAVVVGSNAQADIRRTHCEGAGKAKAGQILGSIAIAGGLVHWIVAIVIISS